MYQYFLATHSKTQGPKTYTVKEPTAFLYLKRFEADFEG